MWFWSLNRRIRDDPPYRGDVFNFPAPRRGEWRGGGWNPDVTSFCLEGFYSFGFEVGEDGVSAATGFAEVTSFEGDSDSPFGVVGLVDGVVDPPGAVVIPEVMIWVF